MVIIEPNTRNEITRHSLCHEKGKLTKGTNHRRDRSKGIPKYMEQVAKVLGDTPKAAEFLEQIH